MTAKIVRSIGGQTNFNLYSLSKEFSRSLMPFNGDYKLFKFDQYQKQSNKEKDRVYENYAKLLGIAFSFFAIVISVIALLKDDTKSMDKRIDSLQNQILKLQNNKQHSFSLSDTFNVKIVPVNSKVKHDKDSVGEKH